jgi:hypothetical protein
LYFRSDCTEGLESGEKAALQIPVEDVRVEWRLLWRDRVDDRVRAECIANRDYSLLFVERGRVVFATRDFKPLNFKEILCLHRVENVERFVSSPPSVGGWGKFARTVLSKQKRARKWKVTKSVPCRKRKNLQLKKGGRGWLRYRMNR